MLRQIVSRVARRAGRRAPAIFGSSTKSTAQARVGWITSDSFPRRKRRFRELHSFTWMRVGQLAEWMNAEQQTLANEIYDPAERYDVVVFQKMMNAQCQEEAATISARGGKVVFDANVNYYEVWGDYFIPGTQPTDEQQRDAHAMTAGADWVVADSSYLEAVIRAINPRVTWIADNVDTSIYRRGAARVANQKARLIWSGVAKKAAHLLLAVDAFATLTNTELVLVVDEPPDCLAELQRAIPCRVVTFSDRDYAAELAVSDVIVSPKRLVNAYEMGHTEYKIALGMACGLPAVASPQQSYVEAIGHRGGGVIADTIDDWRNALRELTIDANRRRSLGELAYRTVHEKYSTPVIGREYLALLQQLAGISGVDHGGR